MENKCWVPYCKTTSAITKNELEEKNTTGEIYEKEKYTCSDKIKDKIK